jgi:hypothetical protein
MDIRQSTLVALVESFDIMTGPGVNGFVHVFGGQVSHLQTRWDGYGRKRSDDCTSRAGVALGEAKLGECGWGRMLALYLLTHLQDFRIYLHFAHKRFILGYRRLPLLIFIHQKREAR